jgi:FkbM family methyltransferase
MADEADSHPTDVEAITAALIERTEHERAKGTYADDLSFVELPRPGSDGSSDLIKGFELDSSEPRIRFRPELGFSSKPVIGPVITLVKRFLLRLQLFVFDDLARQADTAVRRLESALAVEIETRERREWELTRRTSELEAALAQQNFLAQAAGLPDAVEVETNVGVLWSHPNDEITASLQEHGFWEIHLVRLLEKRLRPGMAFLDVGANIGYFTVLASRLVGPSGHVVAVEAEAGNAALLRANVWRHGCANVTVLSIAAWSTFAHPTMNVRAGNRGSSWITESEGEHELRVPAAPLDQVLHERFDLMKLDAEGSEHVILDGARRLLETCPLAVVEFWPRAIPQPKPAEPKEVLESYEALGRDLAVVSVMGDLEPIASEELLQHDAHYVTLALLPKPPRTAAVE